MITLRQWTTYLQIEKKLTLEKYALGINMEREQIKLLQESLEVVDRFFEEAHKIGAIREHYSARTIVEVLRHNSALEDGDSVYKINNAIVPLLSRISMEIFPFLNNLFEVRSQVPSPIEEIIILKEELKEANNKLNSIK